MRARSSFLAIAALAVGFSCCPLKADAANPSSAVVDLIGPSVRSGTGFFVRADGVVMTCAHVAARTGLGRSTTIRTEDGRYFNAIVAALNEKSDIAFLKVAGGPSEFPALPIGRSAQDHNLIPASGGCLILSRAKEKDIVRPVSIGSAYVIGLRRTTGIDYPGLLLSLAASIDPGYSGSPMIDAEGRVAGMVMARLEDGSRQGYAIPAEYLAAAARQYFETGRLQSARLGVEMDLLEGVQGTVVTRVLEPEKTALAAGDRILGIGTVELDSTIRRNGEIIPGILMLYAPGDTVTLTVDRAGQWLEVPATLSPAP